MKKMHFVSIMAIALWMIMTFGCKNNLIDKGIDACGQTSKCDSAVAFNVLLMKENGLFDGIVNDIALRSADSDFSDEDAQILRFINDTDAVLAEIAESENGEKQLRLIEALFTDSTVDDVASAFAAISEDMAEEYLFQVKSLVPEEIVSEINDVSARSAGITDIQKLRTAYFIKNNNSYRGAYAANMDWDTIAWYTGFCAATVAGCVAASYGGFWVRIGGIVAASAGTASIAVQLVRWVSCSDLKNLMQSVLDKNSAAATKVLNEGLGWRYITIIGISTATIVGCYVTPFGKAVVKVVIEKFNALVAKILSILPSGINYTICGIPLKPIII